MRIQANKKIAYLTNNQPRILLQYGSSMQSEEDVCGILAGDSSVVQDTFTAWMETSKLA